MRAHDEARPGESAPGKSTPRWRRALVYLPPLLLTLVALQHFVLSRAAHLVPWKGGGFGMFSSVDLVGNRVLRVMLIAEGREYPGTLGSLDDRFERTVGKTVALPTDARLAQLADELLTRRWRLDKDGVASARAAEGRALRTEAIRLEVHRILFHADSNEVERVLLNEITREAR